MNPTFIKATELLPEHRRLIQDVTAFFQKLPGVSGGFMSGSAVTQTMDSHSDLDFGFLIKDTKARDEIWASRWDWQISPWFHRFDADHIKPYFVIYFFDPSIHVDLNFYVESDLPTSLGAPFEIIFDQTAILKPRAQIHNSNSKQTSVNWESLIHDDERFWAWIHYSYSHAARGELYDVALFIKDLRKIVESWQSRILGFSDFNARKAESIFSKEFYAQMTHTFCKPDRSEIKIAFQTLINVQLQQRELLGKKLHLTWKTTPAAIQHMQGLVHSL